MESNKKIYEVLSVKAFFQKKFLEPIKNLLHQGESPERLALSLSLGVVCCCFPIIGLTTILCVLVAILFKLNHVAIQIANYFSYPLQLALIIPFIKMGEKIFDMPPTDFDISMMVDHFRIDHLGFFEVYGMALLRGCVAWLICAPLASLFLYFPFLGLIKGLFLIRAKIK